MCQGYTDSSIWLLTVSAFSCRNWTLEIATRTPFFIRTSRRYWNTQKCSIVVLKVTEVNHRKQTKVGTRPLLLCCTKKLGDKEVTKRGITSCYSLVLDEFSYSNWTSCLLPTAGWQRQHDGPPFGNSGASGSSHLFLLINYFRYFAVSIVQWISASSWSIFRFREEKDGVTWQLSGFGEFPAVSGEPKLHRIAATVERQILLTLYRSAIVFFVTTFFYEAKYLVYEGIWHFPTWSTSGKIK